MACDCSKPNSGFNKSDLDEVLAQYAKADGGLIPVLQKAQEIYRWLPPEILEYISEKMALPLAKVLGVVTFYTQFRLKPVGKNIIQLCQGTACHVNGSAGIEDAIKEHLGVEEGEMTADGLFTYNNVACIGCCSLAPVMMIDGKTYGGLTNEKTIKALDWCKEAAL